MRLRFCATMAAAVVAMGGCAGQPEVVRVVDGRVLVGPFVEPEAYAAFLRGAVAEDKGDMKTALASYREAASRGADDAEIWTRIGAIRCGTNPRDPEATAAFKRALALDASFAPAWQARGECALARGEVAVAASSATTALASAPVDVASEALLARADAADAHAAEVRDRLIALTLVEGSSVAAWDALAAWGRGHGDAVLVARALASVARLSPSRRAELGQRAVELAGEGEISAARTLAAALLDAEGDRSSGGLGPAPAASSFVARLAVDEALLAGHVERARARATRAHLGLDVVAGRALLFGDPKVARDLAWLVVASDPSATGARLVLAAAAAEMGDARAAGRGLAQMAVPQAPLSAEAILPFARLIAQIGSGKAERALSTEAARRLVEGLARERFLGGDMLLTPMAVELAAAGVLEDAALPAEARIELAARRLETPNVPEGVEVDARHRLFALALAAPLDRSVAALARRLAPAAARDPLIAVALVRVSLARGVAVDQGMLDRLVAIDPADPLVAAAALDVAKRRGDERAIAPARARLTALAVTAGERAHALE